MARRGWLLAGALFFGSSLLSQPGRAQPTGASTQTSEQLLLAIEANNHPLSEGVEALQAADGSIYLPLGEIARLLGFGIAVDPAGSVAKGSGNASSISVDVAAKSITTAKGTEVPMDYRMLKKGDRWLVYDVNIEGVSLVGNYRTQFNKIIKTASYQELVTKLKSGQDFNADRQVDSTDPRFLGHLFVGVGVSLFLPPKVKISQ